ncbi:unnamed protein product, partial [Allacma fusca]
IQNTTSTN